MSRPALTAAWLAPAALAVALSTGCAAGRDDLRTVADEPAAPFEQAMRAWAGCASRGDVDGMLALTSRTTIRTTGLQQLRALYENDVSRALAQSPQMSTGGEQITVIAEDGATGWLFRRVFSSPGGDQLALEILVLREDGQPRVSSYRPWRLAGRPD